MPSEIGHYEEGTMKRALLRRGHMKSDSTMEFYLTNQIPWSLYLTIVVK